MGWGWPEGTYGSGGQISVALPEWRHDFKQERLSSPSGGPATPYTYGHSPASLSNQPNALVSELNLKKTSNSCTMHFLKRGWRLPSIQLPLTQS